MNREQVRLGIYVLDAFWVVGGMGHAITEGSYAIGLTALGTTLLLMLMAEIAGSQKPGS